MYRDLLRPSLGVVGKACGHSIQSDGSANGLRNEVQDSLVCYKTSLATARAAVVKANIIPKQYLMVSFFVCSKAAFRLLFSLSILISSSFVLSLRACISSRILPFSKLRSSLWLAVSLSISYLQSFAIVFIQSVGLLPPLYLMTADKEWCPAS